MENVKRIASFEVDHTTLLPGIYLSRVDGDVSTYDLRTRTPNTGDLMDNETMHSLEHMMATYLRNSQLGDRVVYFGPMGCQTGFYLLVRTADHAETLSYVKEALQKTISHAGEMFGNSAKECGNYKSLSLEKAKKEAGRYLAVLEEKKEWSFCYE
ncbi:MAG: S-ribosylhomocysteine lyase [Ruminococcaceae bacterium]|nr:S-ribosylhomocysteine lyase [Oscillospiraceae bacterium]